MSTRISRFSAAALATVGAATALLVADAGSAAASPAHHDPACDFNVSDIAYGETVAVFCEDGPGEFRAIAHCSNGLSEWWDTGFPGIPGEAPSVAHCAGSLLLGAHVVDYSVIWL